jgi:hypothetical protein
VPWPPAAPAQERRPNDAARGAGPLVAGSVKASGDAADNAPTRPYVPPAVSGRALQPPLEANEIAAPLPPPIHIPTRSASISQPPPAPVETAQPKLDPTLPTDAAQIQQRLFDLGFLPTSPDGKWGQRSARALQEFRAAHKNEAAWDRQTEDALLSSTVAPHAEATPLFAGNWRSEDEACATDGGGPALRITSVRAETANARCDFDSVRRESEGAWRVHAKCFANGDTWQADIQLRVTGQRLIWNYERGRAQYLRCR